MKRMYLLFIGLIVLCSTTHAERIISSANSYYYNLVGPPPTFQHNFELALSGFMSGMFIGSSFLGPEAGFIGGFLAAVSFVGANEIRRDTYNNKVHALCDDHPIFDHRCPTSNSRVVVAYPNPCAIIIEDKEGDKKVQEWHARHSGVQGDYDKKCDPTSLHFDFEYADQFGD